MAVYHVLVAVMVDLCCALSCLLCLQLMLVVEVLSPLLARMNSIHASPELTSVMDYVIAVMAMMRLIVCLHTKHTK